MIATSILTYFDRELTGCIIDEEIKSVDITSPSRSTSTWQTVFNGLARIVDISSLNIIVDVHGKQKREEYCIYLDRALVGTVTEGMRVKFNSSLLGENILLVDDNSSNIIVGYIRRAVKPQNKSLVGKLELYIVTNN